VLTQSKGKPQVEPSRASLNWKGRKTMETVSIYFKAPKQIADLITALADKQGYKSKSSFLTTLIMDGLINFEALRQHDAIADLCDIIEPRLRSLLNESEDAGDMTSLFRRLQTVYCKERLRPHLKVQRKLTASAIESYLNENGDIVEADGVDGFIVRSSIQHIWDTLYSHGIIDEHEWQKHSENYSMYLQHGAQKLIQQE